MTLLVNQKYKKKIINRNKRTFGGRGGGQIENKTILDTFCFNTDYVFIQFTNKQYTIGQIFVKY